MGWGSVDVERQEKWKLTQAHRGGLPSVRGSFCVSASDRKAVSSGRRTMKEKELFYTLLSLEV